MRRSLRLLGRIVLGLIAAFCWSLPLGAECIEPSELDCNLTSDGDVSLIWVNNSEYDTIRIERDEKPLVELAGTATTYVDEQPPPGVPYYRVFGVVDGVDCGVDDWLCALRVCVFGPPTLLSCASVDGDGVPPVEITWESPADADSIVIYRYHPYESRVIAHLPGDAESYTDYLFDEVGRYRYVVRAESETHDCYIDSSSCESDPIGLRLDCSSTAVSVPAGAAMYAYIDWDAAGEDERYVPPDNIDNSPKVEVSVDITMADLGDWSISVTSPEGETVQLHDRGAASAVDLRVTYSEEGWWPVSADNSTCGCLVSPSGPGSLYELVWDPRGEWTLTLEALSEGTVNSWCVGVFSYSDFWRTSSLLHFKRGDANNNGAVDALSDALRLLQWGFSEGLAPPCMCAADANGDGNVVPLLDAIGLLYWGFSGGPAPPAPGPVHCGPGCDLNGVSTHEEACGTTTGHGRTCDP